MCGSFLCALSDCCKDAQGRGEGTSHLLACGGGPGALLLLTDTIVVLMRGTGGCLWHSIYTDEYGEEDVGCVLAIGTSRLKMREKKKRSKDPLTHLSASCSLRRGKPLFVNAERYNQLRLLCLDHQV